MSHHPKQPTQQRAAGILPADGTGDLPGLKEPAPTKESSPEAINRSCRWPVLFLLGHAAFWLGLGVLTAMVAAIQLCYPNLLAFCSALTYGRLQPAAVSMLLYGFASQAALGVAIWMLARLGRATFSTPLLAIAGAGLWNLGTLLGVLGILAGDQTGYTWFALPKYSAGVMFLGYLAVALSAFLNFHQRRERSLYPSQWFLIAGLFWFPWVFSVAQYLLLWHPVRGVMQSVVNLWYVSSLWHLWLGAAGLAVVLYFIPKLTGRPLHSAGLAKYAFWIIAIFGSGCAFNAGLPVPRWLPAISGACNLLLLLALAAVVVNMLKTFGGDFAPLKSQRLLQFIVFGVLGWVLFVLLSWLLSRPSISAVSEFTLLRAARDQIFLGLFLVPVLVGAMGFIIPELAGSPLPCAVMPRVHLAGTVLGGLMLAAALILAGMNQGQAAASADLPYISSVLAARGGLRWAALGWLLIAVGQFAFLTNLLLLGFRSAKACCTCCCSASLKPAEVNP